MAEQKYISIPELAKLLGVSRIAVYKRVRKGEIPATRVGRTFVITDETISAILGNQVTEKGKKQIDDAVLRTAKEYGEVLKRLSKE